jgi:hypothetical protein
LSELNDTLPHVLVGAAYANNTAVCNLDRRLHFRSVSNALSGLVRSLHEGSEIHSAQSGGEFAELLPFIFAKWTGNKSFNVTLSIVLTMLGTELICLVITVVMYQPSSISLSNCLIV